MIRQVIGGCMESRIEQLIDWKEVSAIQKAEHNHPRDILGPKVTEEGILINAYFPSAVKITVIKKRGNQSYEMQKSKEPGFFSILIEGKKIFSYTLTAEFDDGGTYNFEDPYAFHDVMGGLDRAKFTSGIHYNVYQLMGAHKTKQKGISGVAFAVWAPDAVRVSVVGDFNLWDGRRHPMNMDQASGIYELFIPDISVGERYKYEIKASNGDVFLKTDPYGNWTELRPGTASKIADLSTFTWTDLNWIEKRKSQDTTKLPVNIYEVHLGAWKRPEDDREFFNYREIAHQLAEYVCDMGYTHIELMPIMEHPYDPSWGYQVTGYYAPTSRYGTPEDFMYFVNYMHKKGIGVILDWVPAHFPKDACGLGRFDGTALYEHKDPRLGEHPDWGTYIFNYGVKQVSNFLISNAIFWIDQFHIDGIRMDAVASMLYLDYGRSEGQWVPNKDGTNENYEAVEFLKHLNSIVKKRKDGSIMIAEESTTWPYLTKDIKNGGIGFDYKWNMGWMNDFLDYMKTDPLFRKGKHGEITFSMVYAYSEKYILVLSHDEVVHGKGSMIGKMPGEYADKFANLRVGYGFMMAHPGKKLLFMGQELAQFTEFDEKSSVEWFMTKYETHANMQQYVKALNHLYKAEPALYALDTKEKGFEWINKISADESILVFVRKTTHKEDTLLIVCNFTPVKHENYKIGVPYKGKYKEIFNSDAKQFGGSDFRNPRVKTSKADECDDRMNSLQINVPPLGISIFKYRKMK